MTKKELTKAYGLRTTPYTLQEVWDVLKQAVQLFGGTANQNVPSCMFFYIGKDLHVWAKEERGIISIGANRQYVTEDGDRVWCPILNWHQQVKWCAIYEEDRFWGGGPQIVFQGRCCGMHLEVNPKEEEGDKEGKE